MSNFLSPSIILTKYETIARQYNLSPQSLGWLVRMKIISGVSGKNCYLINETSFVTFFRMLLDRDKKKINSIII